MIDGPGGAATGHGSSAQGVLGFGCASLQLAVSREANMRILGAAWDGGVRWFDVARSYSYGAAEGLLGRFLGQRRDEAVVVTKLGLWPPRRLVRSAPVRAVARTAVRLVPAAKSRAVATADALAPRPDFSITRARQSLHTSLRELRTDHVDALLLHEASLSDVADDGLRAWLSACVQQGKVRRWGIATSDLSVTSAICAEVPAATAIVQVPDSLLDPAGDHLPDLPDGSMVSHSMLRTDLPKLRTWLGADPARLATWSARLDADVTDQGVLAQLVLARAVSRPGRPVVLFSSRDVRRCTQAASSRRGCSPEAMASFGALLDAVRTSS